MAANTYNHINALSEDFVVKQPLQESGILGNSTTWDQNKKQKWIGVSI